MLQALPSAPEGAVTRLGTDWWHEDFLSTDAVLCRNNAPLAVLGFALLRRRIPCRILGKDIGEGLIDLVQKLRATSIDELREKLEAYRRREFRKFNNAGKFRSAAAVNDKCDCLKAFFNVTSVAEVVADIKILFEKRENCLTLSTIHKAKGLEWDRVFILDVGLIGSDGQEKNIKWVAVTRAKTQLFYITSK